MNTKQEVDAAIEFLMTLPMFQSESFKQSFVRELVPLLPDKDRKEILNHVISRLGLNRSTLFL